MRIRTIKPEFWSHPIMGRIPERARLLAIALLNHADDLGYFHADPAIVRGSCAPFREDLATIREDLAKLSEVGWVDLREHPTQGQIGHVVNWAKHQKVDHPKASKIETYFIRENLAKVSDKLALYQGTGNREQGMDQGAKVDDDIFSKAAEIIKADQTKPPLAFVPQKSFSDWRAMHPRAFIGKEREDWESLYKIYEYDAMSAMHTKLKEHSRIFYNQAVAWLEQNYEV